MIMLLSIANLYNLANLYKLTKVLIMCEEKIFSEIRNSLDAAPRNQYTVELHLQMIKYADELTSITSKEFCNGVGLKHSLGTEFSKMRNLTHRLKKAGLDVDLI